MKKIILLAFFLIPIYCNAQPLGAERVKKLKETVVRVLIENEPSGTAFFVTQEGVLFSCWHVVEPAMIRDSVTNAIIGIRNIEIEFLSREKVKVDIPIDIIQKNYNEALAYDYVVLFLLEKPKTNFSHLKLGNFNNVKEGDVVYSNGYPLGISQNFISVGILSSKWTDTISIFNLGKQIASYSRNVAWLDLTMNKGNSGGPIIKLGINPQDDEVIGIATFILNPFAQEAEKLIQFSMNNQGDLGFGGISMNKLNAFFAEAIYKNSIGVSGCVSINHLLETTK